MTTNSTENLVKATNVIGLKVLSKSNGLQFTKVRDIMYDPRTQRVVYLVTNEEGWFSEAKVIPFSSIDIIGPDRVMVSNEQVEVKASATGYDLNTLIQNDDIIKNLSIVTENGEKLGKVVDFYFDAQSGVVREFEVSQGLLNDIAGGTKSLRVKAIKLVGVDAVIVEPETTDQFHEQAEHQGMKGAVNSAGAAVIGTSVAAKDKVVEAATNFVEEAKPKIEELKQSTMETKDKVVEASQPYIERMQNMASDAKDKIAETAQNTMDSAKPIVQDMKDKVDQNTPNSREEMMDGARQKVDEAKQAWQSGTEQVGNFAKEKMDGLNDKIEQSQIDSAIGYTLIRDIIDPKSNEMIATKGDIIDAKVIDKAKSLGILHLVTNGSSYV